MTERGSDGVPSSDEQCACGRPLTDAGACSLCEYVPERCNCAGRSVQGPRPTLRDMAEGADERRKTPGVPDDLTALASRRMTTHRNAGYSQCDGRYVARCDCGWQTTRRTTYERAQQALRQHLATMPEGRKAALPKHLGVRQSDGTYRCLTCDGVFVGWQSPYCPGKTPPARKATSDA